MQISLAPTVIVIFGGTGNLAQTKLIPALLDLFEAGNLPKQFRIVGLARGDYNHTTYQSFVKKSIDAAGHAHDEHVVQEFCEHLRFVQGSFDQAESYQVLKPLIEELDSEIGQCTNKLYYLSVPPKLYGHMFEAIAEHGLMDLCDGEHSWARILVEKPFGNDFETAQELEDKLSRLYRDEQIFRIDHYLAKDAIESLMTLRSVNSVIASTLSNAYVESIKVELLETKDVATRGSFYDGLGALRDVGGNHILQMLALIAMEEVELGDAAAIRAARAAVVEHVKICEDAHAVVRGQYAGYQDIDGVAEGSQTETYFRLCAEIDNDTWRGVPMILESGKALKEARVAVTVTFKGVDECTCAAETGVHRHHDVLTVTFAPEQAVTLSVWVKRPGFDFVLEERTLTLDRQTTQQYRSPEAYEKVLYDCIVGDQRRFVSSAEVKAAWAFITPIFETWHDVDLEIYQPGSNGPDNI